MSEEMYHDEGKGLRGWIRRKLGKGFLWGCVTGAILALAFCTPSADACELVRRNL